MLDRLKFAISTRSLNLPFREVARIAAEAMIPGLQIDIRNDVRPESLTDSGRRQLLRELEERHLQVASLWLPLRHSLYEQDHLDERVAAIRAGLQFAFQLKSGQLCLRIGRLPAADSKDYELLLEVVNDLARYGNHVGAELCITPMGEGPAAWSAFLARCQAGPVGIDFDPGGAAMHGRTPHQDLRELHALIRHVQLRDGLRDIDGTGEETSLGRGEVEWEEYIATLSEIEYTGWLTSVRLNGDDRLGDALRGVQYVRRIILGE